MVVVPFTTKSSNTMVAWITATVIISSDETWTGPIMGSSVVRETDFSTTHRWIIEDHHTIKSNVGKTPPNNGNSAPMAMTTATTTITINTLKLIISHSMTKLTKTFSIMSSLCSIEMKWASLNRVITTKTELMAKLPMTDGQRWIEINKCSGVIMIQAMGDSRKITIILTG